ncbi:hypothetical protein [Alloacidobacterium sp.]|uniref:hypothetical protein n=1 Tax=Alloacidobacterium sp. TaxID=2951999 RepID=UPI002D74D4F0|nr:hypothetical protein [Alloacidobacterium sp.]HYK37147.1 hypothetical protein [Alloacidobacterium sp.]
MQNLLKIRNLFLALLLCAVPAASFAQVSIGIGISIHTAPPVLPVYAQPPCPADGYLWTPGYWAYGPMGYYWVPGVWVRPPQVGYLWTPGYWGFVGGVYAWHAGYWGPHVGFYGGVNYGFGYGGVGFVGGMWQGGAFHYNTAVMNVNTTIVHNTYINRTVVNNVTINNVNRTSFNGPGGLAAQPTAQEQAAIHEAHFQATSEQLSHRQTAGQDRNQLASVNHGRPSTMAMNTVNGRRYDQQGRIANGVASGQFTAGETRNLEGREANLNHEVRTDRQANGGALTQQERQQVNRQQNNLSRSIYDDKHNASAAGYGNNQVGARRDEQQQRIGQGIRNGQMSPSEAARTENREANINHQVGADRNANGGKLTQQEHQQVNREQNGASREIYNDKHNGKTAPR